MTIRTVRGYGMHLLTCCALAVSAMPVSAQVIPVIPNQTNREQLTPQQLQNLKMMRAMQSRGRNAVQTGIPQNIQMGPGLGGPMLPAATEAPPKSRKSSAEKRAAARQAREEQKRIAKDKAKKAKLAKADQAAADAK